MSKNMKGVWGQINQIKKQLKDAEYEIQEVKGWSTRNFTGIGINRRRTSIMRDQVNHMHDLLFPPGNNNNNNGGVGGGKRRKRTRGKLRAKSRAKSRKKRRRKRGGTRKNAGPEKPIVGYYYRINIYHGGQGEKVLQYGNVIGKYLGLAEEFHDGFQGEDKKKLMFRTPHITDDDGPRELTGEIISKIGPSITYINGGRRKKRTKKRRKSRRKKRRKSRR